MRQVTTMTSGPVPTVGLATVTALHDARPAPARRTPRLRTGVLERQRLHRRLTQAADVPLVMLVAPAGYGKTTLLAQWARAERRPSRWISLQAGDDRPQRVIAMIARALDDLGDGAPRLRPGTRVTLGGIAQSLERVSGPFTLILDDLHHVQSAEALEALAAIVELLPEGAQLALASREEPALPVGVLRAQGKLVDLRTRDLAMTRTEASAMLRLAGLELSPADVLILLERTEGWPAALYLAALSLRGAPDPHAGVVRFGGDDRLAADYLRDELLSGLDPERVEFLRRTSVLDLLDGPRCDAVLGRSGSADLLRQLSRANALVTAVDSTDATFRCHPMLASMLSTELHRTDPRLALDLHRRASAHHAGRGELDDAIEHAIAAGDLPRVGELVWSAAAAHLLDGRRSEVCRWLDAVGRQHIAGEPALALSEAACHLAAGQRDLAEHWADIAAQAIPDDGARSLRSGLAMLRAAVARDGLAGMDADAARAYELAPQDSPWRSLACLLRGVAAHLRGDPQAARRWLEEGARRGAIVAPTAQALCLAQLALVALEGGDWGDGQLLAARAIAQVERRGLAEDPACMLVFAVSALVRAHRDRVEVAQGDRHRAMELLSAVEDHAPWVEIETRVSLVRAALRLGDVAGARMLLAEATRMASRPDAMPGLRSWIDDLRSQVDAFAVTALVGPSSLTTAELRVLALLPTHLSFPEMGRRLHVSGNTIKTHAHAVYRKLDVCSRSEAVVRARETGLLDLKEETPCPSS